MATKKKQYKDYQEYLDSPEWKALKEEFYDQYDGFTNVCQITGCDLDDSDVDSDNYMCLHHWRYPKNWNDDSIENLILVRNCTHKWIHEDSENYCNAHDKEVYNTKQKYICSIISGWNDFKEEISCVNEHRILSHYSDKNKELEESVLIKKDHIKHLFRENNELKLKLSIAKENAVNTCVALKED